MMSGQCCVNCVDETVRERITFLSWNQFRNVTSNPRVTKETWFLFYGMRPQPCKYKLPCFTYISKLPRLVKFCFLNFWVNRVENQCIMNVPYCCFQGNTLVFTWSSLNCTGKGKGARCRVSSHFTTLPFHFQLSQVVLNERGLLIAEMQVNCEAIPAFSHLKLEIWPHPNTFSYICEVKSQIPAYNIQIHYFNTTVHVSAMFWFIIVK